MNICIIYQRYIDEINHRTVIGGLQNYVENLCQLAIELHYDVYIFQFSTFEFEQCMDNGIHLYGIEKHHRNWTKDLVAKAENICDTNNDLLVFATSTQIVEHRFKHSMCIQHGIYWDIPTVHGKCIKYPFDIFLRSVQAAREIKLVKKVNQIICVDYNYINWIRTQITDRTIKYTVIPNFAEICDVYEKNTENVIRIVFSRRFEEIRGVHILMGVMPRILEEYPAVELTIAGNGTFSKELHNIFASSERVEFTEYSPNEGVKFHERFDIALIPTIGSEGTSLSLLEAMSAGCAVICSDVGGMSNVVLDKFNGQIVKPTADEFYKAIKMFLDNEVFRNQCQCNARETIKKAFSLELWKSKWTDVLNNIK